MYNFIAMGGSLYSRFPAIFAFDPWADFVWEVTVPVIPKVNPHIVLTKRNKIGSSRKWRWAWY